MFDDAIVKKPLPIVAILTSLTCPAPATEPTEQRFACPATPWQGPDLEVLADRLPSVRLD
jgi:hypothetical protein